jgi:hypothetical protein
VALSVVAGEAGAEDGREPQGDLLGADGPDHGSEEVGLEHGAGPGEAGGDPGDHRVGRGQLGQRVRCGRERAGQHAPGRLGVGAGLGRDQQRRVGHRPRRPGGRPDHAAVHRQRAQPHLAVPPVEQVVARAPEHVQAPHQVDRPADGYDDHSTRQLVGGHAS